MDVYISVDQFLLIFFPRGQLKAGLGPLLFLMERVTGFEPVPIAWKAIVLAINTTPAQKLYYKRKKGHKPLFLDS